MSGQRGGGSIEQWKCNYRRNIIIVFILFFNRGFGAKKREDVEPYAAIHGPLLTVSHPAEDTPKAPPRRKRPQRLINAEDGEKSPSIPLRRSLSFTDAHYIAQAMCEGDTKLIEELYPDFPRSEPIYAGKYFQQFHEKKIREFFFL